MPKEGDPGLGARGGDVPASGKGHDPGREDVRLGHSELVPLQVVRSGTG